MGCAAIDGELVAELLRNGLKMSEIREALSMNSRSPR